MNDKYSTKTTIDQRRMFLRGEFKKQKERYERELESLRKKEKKTTEQLKQLSSLAEAVVEQRKTADYCYEIESEMSKVERWLSRNVEKKNEILIKFINY